MVDVFDALDLQVCKQRSYLWAAKRAKSWDGLVKQMAWPPSYFRWPAIATSSSSSTSSSYHLASTPLLLLIVARSSTHRHCCGGADSEVDRKLWNHLLDGMFARLLAFTSSFDLTMFGCPNRWRPPCRLTGEYPVHFVVEDGKVDIQRLLPEVQHAMLMLGVHRSKLAAEITQLADQEVSLKTMLLSILGIAESKSFWMGRQLVLLLGQLLERALLHDDAAAAAADSIGLAMTDRADGSRPCDRERQVAQYLMAVRETIGKTSSYLHLSFDKTTVGSKRQLCIVGTVGKVGFYLPPQVLCLKTLTHTQLFCIIKF